MVVFSRTATFSLGWISLTHESAAIRPQSIADPLSLGGTHSGTKAREGPRLSTDGFLQSVIDCGLLSARDTMFFDSYYT